jgi:hypothetical protein
VSTWPPYRRTSFTSTAGIRLMPPAGQWLFGTAPLPGGAWLVALPFALAMVLLEEERKAWMRRRAGRIRPLS